MTLTICIIIIGITIGGRQRIAWNWASTILPQINPSHYHYNCFHLGLPCGTFHSRHLNCLWIHWCDISKPYWIHFTRRFLRKSCTIIRGIVKENKVFMVFKAGRMGVDYIWKR